MIPGSRSKLLLSFFLLLGVLTAGGWLFFSGKTKKESSLESAREMVTTEEFKPREVQSSKIQGNIQGNNAAASPATGSTGVFDKIASEVSGVYEKAAPSVKKKKK